MLAHAGILYFSASILTTLGSLKSMSGFWSQPSKDSPFCLAPAHTSSTVWSSLQAMQDAVIASQHILPSPSPPPPFRHCGYLGVRPSFSVASASLSVQARQPPPSLSFWGIFPYLAQSATTQRQRRWAPTGSVAQSGA